MIKKTSETEFIWLLIRFASFVTGNSMPLPGKQDILPAFLAIVSGERLRPNAPLAARQTGPSPHSPLSTPLGSRYHWHVLHPRLQRQPEFSTHPIAITSELLRWGTVQNTNLRRLLKVCLQYLPRNYDCELRKGVRYSTRLLNCNSIQVLNWR